jgi:hypothetical protein
VSVNHYNHSGFPLYLSSVQNLAKIEAAKKTKNQGKSGDNLQNQLLNSGEFLPEGRYKNQETPGQIRRFGNPDCKCHQLFNADGSQYFGFISRNEWCDERRGGGGENSLTADERNVLRQLFYKYPHEISARINYRFYRRTSVTISSRTLRNYRRLSDFHPIHARTQTLINNEHAQQRLFFSQRHIDHDWSRVIFSDEKAFEVDLSGIVYWIPYGRPRPTSFTSQIEFRIAVFGAVWYNSKSDLVLIRGQRL